MGTVLACVCSNRAVPACTAGKQATAEKSAANKRARTARDETMADSKVRSVKADCGSRALERLLERQFAIVLLDVRMPDIDGFDVAKLMHPRYGRGRSERTHRGRGRRRSEYQFCESLKYSSGGEQWARDIFRYYQEVVSHG